MTGQRRPATPTRKKVPRKPKPKPAPEPEKWYEGFDWYAIALVLLGCLTVAPYAIKFLRNVQIVIPDVPTPPGPDKPQPPARDWSQAIAKVPVWLQFVPDASEEQRTAYAAALEETATKCKERTIPALADIDDRLKEATTERIGDTGWLDWSLFTLELFREMQAMRASGKISSSVEEHGQFLTQVAAVVRKGG